MSETLTETFARFAEDAEFRHWNAGRTVAVRFVYVRQDSSVWKFTLEEWWKFVTKAIRANGAYTLPQSKQVHDRQRLVQINDLWLSGDTTIRRVDLLSWTVDDWKSELAAI